jgi:hypothetical protein
MLGAHQDMQVPDAVSPAIGWRSWRVRDNYGEPVLISPSQGDVWTPGSAKLARCRHSERAREKGCHCGINAWDSRERIEQSGEYRSAEVWGQVLLWGEVHEFDRGLRAQWGAVGELFVSPRACGGQEQAAELAAKLAKTYRVPVSVAERQGTSAAEVDPPTRREFALRLLAFAVITAWAYALPTTVQQLVIADWDGAHLSMWPVPVSGILSMAAVLIGAFVILARAGSAIYTQLQMFVLAPVITAALAAVLLACVHTDNPQGERQLDRRGRIDRVYETGRAQKVALSAANHDAWIWHWGSIDGCETKWGRSHVSEAQVCRTGRTVTIRPTRSRQAHFDLLRAVEERGPWLAMPGRCTTSLGVRACIAPGAERVIVEPVRVGAPPAMPGRAARMRIEREEDT